MMAPWETAQLIYAYVRPYRADTCVKIASPSTVFTVMYNFFTVNCELKI